MILCYQCRHWKGNRTSVTDPEASSLMSPADEWRDGECERLHRILGVEINAGWDGGTVASICTPASFGCVMGEETVPPTVIASPTFSSPIP